MIGFQPRAVRQKLSFTDPAIWIATWFGSGLIRPMPGTWGTLAALPFAYLLLVLHPWALLLAVLLILPLSLWAAERFTATVKDKDSSMIVVDEVIGVWIALLPVDPSLSSFAIGFCVFRFFDIVKPWPISWLDKNVKGAPGVMADDMLAGIFTAFCLIGLHYAGLG